MVVDVAVPTAYATPAVASRTPPAAPSTTARRPRSARIFLMRGFLSSIAPPSHPVAAGAIQAPQRGASVARGGRRDGRPARRGRLRALTAQRQPDARRDARHREQAPRDALAELCRDRPRAGVGDRPADAEDDAP